MHIKVTQLMWLVLYREASWQSPDLPVPASQGVRTVYHGIKDIW